MTISPCGPGARTPEQIALARAVLTHIEAHPDKWYQASWRCRSGMCYAGHTAALSGRKWMIEDPIEAASLLAPADLLVAHADDPMAWDYNLGYAARKKMVVSVREVAQRLLGLDDNEASIMFDGGNSLDDLRRYVRKIEQGRRVSDSVGSGE